MPLDTLEEAPQGASEELLLGASGVIRSTRTASGYAVGPVIPLVVFGAPPSVAVAPRASVDHGVVVLGLPCGRGEWLGDWHRQPGRHRLPRQHPSGIRSNP